MIRVRKVGHDLAFPVADILRLFCEGKPVVHAEWTTCDDPREIELTSAVIRSSKGYVVETSCGEDNLVDSIPEAFPQGSDAPTSLPVSVRRAVKRQLYALLSRATGIRYPWGSLTGIRPTVLARERLGSGDTPAQAALALTDRYDVESDKAELAVSASRMEDRVLARMRDDESCLYVSVPFCATRCGYCSFPTATVDAVRPLLPAYVEALLREAAIVGGSLAASGRRARCLYVGGGSPAVLPPDLLERLLEGLRDSIPWSVGREFTFEAGRCDDLDGERISLLGTFSVDRLCLNPQTTDPETLGRIGRPEAGERLGRWARAARAAGIPVLNMDLIAGLPGEGEASFARSLGDVLALSPENVTIHALSIKRGSAFADRKPVRPSEGVAPVAGMIRSAMGRLREEGYAPYYLYRQKDIVEGLENTGYALPGTECLYNVAMMSDRREIHGLGAGATTKRWTDGSPDLVRRIHPRNLPDYLGLFAPSGSGR